MKKKKKIKKNKKKRNWKNLKKKIPNIEYTQKVYPYHIIYY